MVMVTYQEGVKNRGQTHHAIQFFVSFKGYSCGMAFFFYKYNELTFVNKSTAMTAEIPTKRLKFMIIVSLYR